MFLKIFVLGVLLAVLTGFGGRALTDAASGDARDTQLETVQILVRGARLRLALIDKRIDQIFDDGAYPSDPDYRIAPMLKAAVDRVEAAEALYKILSRE